MLLLLLKVPDGLAPNAVLTLLGDDVLLALALTVAFAGGASGLPLGRLRRLAFLVKKLLVTTPSFNIAARIPEWRRLLPMRRRCLSLGDFGFSTGCSSVDGVFSGSAVSVVSAL